MVTLAGDSIQKQKALDYLIQLGIKVNLLQKHETQERIKLVEGGV